MSDYFSDNPQALIANLQSTVSALQMQNSTLNGLVNQLYSRLSSIEAVVSSENAARVNALSSMQNQVNTLYNSAASTNGYVQGLSDRVETLRLVVQSSVLRLSLLIQQVNQASGGNPMVLKELESVTESLKHLSVS